MSDILTLYPLNDNFTYRLNLDQTLCVGPEDRRFMFGGTGIAAAVAAMEKATGRPLIWATVQFLDYAQPGDNLDITVDIPKIGRSLSQARVTAKDNDRLIFSGLGALGSTNSTRTHQWARAQGAPDIPGPMDCPPGKELTQYSPNIVERFEVRMAHGGWNESHSGKISPDGRTLMWIRPREDFRFSAVLLAVIADTLPGCTGANFGEALPSTSLDNTLRIHRPDFDTEWVLFDIQFEDCHNGLAIGHGNFYAEDGTFLASASQSCILRSP